MAKDPNDLWLGDSPWVAVAKAEYEMLGLDRWNNDRVNRLCGLLHCTAFDLCAICGVVKRSTVESYQRKNQWPMVLTLHFWKLERVRVRMNTPDIQDVLAAKIFNWT